MGLDDFLKDKFKEKIDRDGIYISKSWDIRVVENFFKKLFGKKTKPEEKDNERHEGDSGRDI